MTDCVGAIKQVWPAHLQGVAIEVMTIESRNNPNIHNLNHKTGDDSWGCFQINRYGRLAASRPNPEWLKNAINNVSYAYDMYKSQGWTPWKNTMKKLGR